METSESFNFQSIQETDFAGHEGDANRYMPPEKPEETHINEYGVRVRGKRKAANHDEGDEIISFSVNMG